MHAAWVDGRIVEGDEPAISTRDQALVGNGVFEAIKVVDRVPFALTRHLNRLVASAQPLAIDVPLATVREAVSQVLATDAAGQSPCWLRVTVTAGPAGMATGDRTQPTVVAAVAPMAPWGPTSDVVVVPWARNDRGALAGLKTTSYAENAIALGHARSVGADEGIFLNTAGNLCEGAGSNVFVVLDGELVTPPLTSGCLAGVTRELVIEWFSEVGERDVAGERLAEVEEAFLTSTSRDVHPIRSFDGRVLPAPGPVTERAGVVFAERARETPDP